LGGGETAMSASPRSSKSDRAWNEILSDYRTIGETIGDGIANELWAVRLGTTANELPPNDPILTARLELTGCLERNKYCVRINESEVWLSRRLFEAMCLLVRARLIAGVDGMGLTRLVHDEDAPSVDAERRAKYSAWQTAKALRSAIETAVDDEDFAMQMIRVRGKGQYSLGILPTNIVAHVRLRELAPTHIPVEVAETILRLAGPLGK
jgi:hypothetical protein